MINPPLPWTAQILTHDSPASLACGQAVTVNLRAKLACLSNRVYGVRLPLFIAYRWLDQNEQPQTDVTVHRTTVPTIAFNQEFAFNALLAAPNISGAYHVQWHFTLGDAAAGSGLAPAANAPTQIAIRVSALPDMINNWRVESNINFAEMGSSLDGDPKTAWDSRTAQAHGQWVRLNLSKPRLIDGIQVLSPGNGFPRGYALNVSVDRDAWCELANVPSGNVDSVSVAFAPQAMQYMQIDLTAAAQTSWKISEIRLHPGIEWRVNASHHPETAHSAIDNRADTAWASGSPQEPGMWFQLDLGRAEAVEGVRLTAPGNESPLAFRIAAWDAGEWKWQVVFSSSQNFGAVDARFDAVQTQFINIQLVEPHSEPWAIRNLHVYRKMSDWLGPTSGNETASSLGLKSSA